MRVIELLEEAIQETTRLEDEAEIALSRRTPSGVTSYQDLLTKRAEIIRDLPAKIRPATEELPREQRVEVLRRLEHWAGRAEEALSAEGDNSFLLGVLLTRREDQVDDPNDLEKLLAEIPGQPVHS